jgi:hypothetical protein
MLDMNTYWMEERFDKENLIYCINNFKPTRFYVGLVGRGFSRETLMDKSLEDKILTCTINKNQFIFNLNNEPLFIFDRDHKKGFDIRYDLGKYDNKSKSFEKISKLVQVNYKKGQYMEIHFSGKIIVEPTEFERAEGLPFYKIKKV